MAVDPSQLLSVLRNPLNLGQGAQAPAELPEEKHEREEQEERGRQARATRSAPSQGRGAVRAGRVCVAYGSEKGYAQLFIDDPDDYANVVSVEVEIEIAKVLVPFLREIAEVRVLIPVDVGQDHRVVTLKGRKREPKSPE